MDIGKNILGSIFGGGGRNGGGQSGPGFAFNNQGTVNNNGNFNTGHMDGGSQNIGTQSFGTGNQSNNVNGLDIGGLLQNLLGAFTQKSFNGQTQYINKQTGQSATCEDLKSFLQDQIDQAQSNYGNIQINGNYNSGTMNGGGQNFYQQQQWNGYPYGTYQQVQYNHYG